MPRKSRSRRNAAVYSQRTVEFTGTFEAEVSFIYRAGVKLRGRA
jgi:hypothetical protein